MKKFAFIGAGSYTFTRNLVRDLFTFPAFEDCHIALMDINPLRLEKITACVNKINAAFGNKATVTSTMNRAEALEGADGVVCTVFNGDIDIWRYDIEIPKEYGVDINVGDTRSVSGIFRALRNIPLMLDICRDIEKYCPKGRVPELHQSHEHALQGHAGQHQGRSDRPVPQRSGDGQDAGGMDRRSARRHDLHLRGRESSGLLYRPALQGRGRLSSAAQGAGKP